MSYKVKTIPRFDKALKKLAKKYPSLKNEYVALIELLENNPFAGIPIGRSCYKIRVAIKSKGKGKSGGGRIITNVLVSESTVFLLSIYDKSDKDSLSDSELLELLNFIKAK